MAIRWLWLGLMGPWMVGCYDEPGWRPPAPAGVTYRYDYQGFQEKQRGGFGGVAMVTPAVGLAYGGAFNFHNQSEVRSSGVKEPLAQSSPINGVQFNPHLEAFGKPLTPSGLPLANAPGGPAPSSSGSPGAASSAGPAPVGSR